MPKIGAEPERRRELISAAVRAIGESGSLDVSVKDIARRAGMSSALAFHYFGGKEEIIFETMRHLLRELTGSFARQLKSARHPLARLEAIVEASFATGQFERDVAAAWLVFYVHAFSSPSAGRLLNIYTRRLASNLIHAYGQLLIDNETAKQAAESTGSMIDGLYIRHALRPAGPDRREAIRLCKAQITDRLARGAR